MRITEKQLQMMMQILSDSVSTDAKSIFLLDFETRRKLYTAILHQQSDEIKEVTNEQ